MILRHTSIPFFIITSSFLKSIRFEYNVTGQLRSSLSLLHVSLSPCLSFDSFLQSCFSFSPHLTFHCNSSFCHFLLFCFNTHLFSIRFDPSGFIIIPHILSFFSFSLSSFSLSPTSPLVSFLNQTVTNVLKKSREEGRTQFMLRVTSKINNTDYNNRNEWRGIFLIIILPSQQFFSLISLFRKRERERAKGGKEEWERWGWEK